MWRPSDQGGAHCLAFSADGKTLASGHHSHLHVRDAVTGQLRQHFWPHGDFVRGIGYLPDGKLVSAGGGDKGMDQTMRLWDAAAKSRLHEYGIDRGYGTTMAASPDGRLLAWACVTTIRLFETSTQQKIGEFHGHRRHVSALAFNPDGRTLASGGADGAILFWDLTGHRRDGRYVGEVVKKDDLPALWEKMANPETGRRVMWRLILSPDLTVPFLQQRIPVVPKAEPPQVRRLLADLDSDSFATRERATRELKKLGDAAVPALQRTLKEKPTPEVAQRVKGLLEGIERKRLERQQRLSLPTLQTLRAIEVLERIGTPEARMVLRKIADGEPTSFQTREAQAALTRLR